MRIERKRRLRVGAAFIMASLACSGVLLLFLLAAGELSSPDATVIFYFLGAFLFGRYAAALLPESLPVKYRVILGAAICFVVEAAVYSLLEAASFQRRTVASATAGFMAAAPGAMIIWSSLRPWRSLLPRVLWTGFDTIFVGWLAIFAYGSCLWFGDNGIWSPIYVWRHMNDTMIRHWDEFSILLSACSGLIVFIVLTDYIWRPRAPYQERRSERKVR